MLTNLPEWQALQAHYQALRGQRMRDSFAKDPERFSRFSVRLGALLLDYSKNRMTAETMSLLGQLATAVNLPQKIQALFSAEPVNSTENRPALHMALRAKHQQTLGGLGTQVMPEVQAVLKQMRDFVEAVHSGELKGSSGKTYRDIVNIGIGGSNLGPLMATQALASYAKADCRFHFVSDVDDYALQEVLALLDPERTLFIVSSKSFTTLETLVNANNCYQWLESRLQPLLPTATKEQLLNSHFVAVTAKLDQAKAFGLHQENIFSIWDWVGGRYSIWSAIGLPLALQIGMDGFEDFLAGAEEADHHFCTAPWTDNIPVILALLGVWYLNFFEAPTQAIIPYDYRMKHLRAYLQQLDMESNGKGITHAGNETSYLTGPIVWGELGLHGQHAFHQLLHQGTHLVPVDFLLVGLKGRKGSSSATHELLIANALSQARALMMGKEAAEFSSELKDKSGSAAERSRLAKHKEIPGNRPSNILFMDELSPKNLGALIAIYEHKIFVQSVIWNVNPFDQWGVELGKTMLPSVLDAFNEDHSLDQHDSSTKNLIRHYKNLKATI